MDAKEYKKSILDKTIAIANEMIADKINLIQGVRIIDSLLYEFDFLSEDLVDFFKAIESETDHLPIDESVRKNWNKDALKNYDLEMNEYIEKERDDIKRSCKTLISSLDGK